MAQEFELRRRCDDLVYRFTRDGLGVYRRADRPELTIQWDPHFGWAAFDPETEQLAGCAWGVPAAHHGRIPPAGPWVSCKGQKSYVYDLVHVSRADGGSAVAMGQV
ncbi:MAG: hypothetical protein AB8B71_13990 [Paracoccaceae bacterium]